MYFFCIHCHVRQSFNKMNTLPSISLPSIFFNLPYSPIMDKKGDLERESVWGCGGCGGVGGGGWGWGVSWGRVINLALERHWLDAYIHHSMFCLWRSIIRIVELHSFELRCKCYRFVDFHNLIMVLHNWILKFHGWIVKVPNNYREFNEWFIDSHNSIYDICSSNPVDP